ncbi:hypothetical protein CRYUN_Cryun38cG0010200 [Craigia yunnanensis]
MMFLQAKSSSVEGSIKYKNLLGYGDLWDGSIAYGFDHSAEVSAGVYFPRLKALVTSVTACAYLLTQDSLNFSSYKERSIGISLGLFSKRYHNLDYHLAWRILADSSQMSSSSVRRQLGHNLLSSLKHTLKIDRRNSLVRPTRGYAFVSKTKIGGLAPDSHSLRFLRQVWYCAYTSYRGFNYTLSSYFGESVLEQDYIPTRKILLRWQSLSSLCLGGPKALWGFKTRGLGSCGLEKGESTHVFACAGNVAKLTENEYQSFSIQKFMESFRSSVGVGIFIPTSLFRLEVNYCYILKKFDHDHAKAGFWLTFSHQS